MKSVRAGARLVAVALLAGCTGPTPEERAAEMARMKEEIRREVLAELQANPPAAGAPAAGAPAGAGAAPVAPSPDPATLGTVTGRVLAQGQGVADCRVKLVRLLETAVLLDAFKTFQEGAEFETVSGRDGTFRIESVPAGNYAARWLPNGETGWIRRLNGKPDVVVAAGAVAQLADFDLQRVTIVSK
jgi:hypothetical protein